MIANAGAYALGRKTDEMIIAALATANTLTVAEANTGLTIGKVLSAFEQLGTADVPDDGERYCLVGYKQWSQLLQIDEFANSEFVGSDDLPFNGTQAKRWLGSLYMPMTGAAD